MEADMATTKNEMLDALLQRMDDALANGKRLPWQKPWEPQFGELSAPPPSVAGRTSDGAYRWGDRNL